MLYPGILQREKPRSLRTAKNRKMSRKLMIPRSSNESNNFIIKRMINDRFFNLVGITRAWRSTSPSCQREHRHKTNVKDEDWQHLETGANH